MRAESKRRMLLTSITLLLLTVMAVNHAVHGFGCWGLQPGGPLSGLIYDLQIFAALAGTMWLLTSLTRGRVGYGFVQLLAIAAFLTASAITFWLYGWAAHTTAHHQGAENLIAFLAVAATTYLIGRYHAPVHVAAHNQPKCHELLNTDTTLNPYKSPSIGESTARRVL